MSKEGGRRASATKLIATGTIFAAVSAVVAGCDPIASLHGALSRGAAANQSALQTSVGNAASPNGSATNHQASENRATSTTQPSKSSGQAVHPFAGGTFDPRHLFSVYNDQVSVTESGGTVFVAWESYMHGDMVYTSVAQNGHWVAQDVPVYSLASLSADGNWSQYLSGDCLTVVNRFNDNSFIVKWGTNGALTQQHVLYKGWVGGDFSIRDGDELAVALHLPYGAPTGGARYNLYFPTSPLHPTTVTTNAAQFSGALYAFDGTKQRLIEARHVQTGSPVLDAYQLPSGTGGSSATGGSASSGSSVLANTLPVARANGQPLKVDLKSFPDQLAVDGHGTVYTIARITPDAVAVVAYDSGLKQTRTWPHIQIANRYAQNVALTVSGSAPHLWDVYQQNGLAELQQVSFDG